MSNGKKGAPRIFKTSDELWDWFKKYLEYIQENPTEKKIWVGREAHERIEKLYDPPTWQGFEFFLFQNEVCTSLDRYRRNVDGAYKDFIGIIRVISNYMFSKKFSGAANNVWNHQIIAKEIGLAEIQHVTNFKRPILENGKELPKDE